MEVQQKTSLKNELLYKRIETLTDAVELREVEIGEMKSAADPSHKKVNKKLEVCFFMCIINSITSFKTIRKNK